MGSINKVILIGRLGTDPELRYTSSGNPVAKLSLATSYPKGADSPGEMRTEWHRIVAWGKLAETCNQHLAKGRQICVEGRLQTRSWEDKDGIKRFSTEIVANSVTFLDSKTNVREDVKNEANETPEKVKDNSYLEEDIPF